MTEYQRAKQWREDRGLSVEQLAKLTGYGSRALYWMELGQTPPNSHRKKPGKVAPWIWLRYKRICQGVQAELDGQGFDW